jgi:hypothetical protein
MDAQPLRAAELREALRLVAAELDALGTHPADPYRWGQLTASIDGLLDTATDGYARIALRLLRHRATQQPGEEVRSP